MNKISPLTLIAIVILTFIVLFAAIQSTVESTVVAQISGDQIEGMTLFAAPRRDTENDESFMFYNRKTGDIWVYRNESFKEHYRIKELGQDLEKIEK